MVIETRSPEETFAVGKSLGEKAFPGQVLTLTGDLGVGKTVFTQGLAEGLGIEGVSLIEWANLIEEILPERRTNILIEKDLTQGFDYRRITIEEQ